jgi:hypothetical protein
VVPDRCQGGIERAKLPANGGEIVDEGGRADRVRDAA